MKRIALVALLALAALGLWLWIALRVPYQGYPTGGVFIEIPRGTPTGAIARILSEKGIVRSRVAFEGLGRWHARQALQAGDYFFERPMTAFEVFRVLAEGRVYVHTVTVPEGLTMFDIAELMEQQGLCRREEFLAAARDPLPIRDLAPHARSLEGFLFPATYQFRRRITAPEIVETMVRRFREVWDSFPERGRNPHGLSVAEVVTMASLVEGETGLPDERLIIAGVFYNRLHRGVALQCDPTVIYALRLANRYTGTLQKSDLDSDSPYNTYRRLGLPPGPIVNPGQASLRVVLFPPDVDYLYFVSNTQGGHFFSKTLAEHNNNVARYRRLLAQAQSGGEKSNDLRPEKSPRARSPR